MINNIDEIAQPILLRYGTPRRVEPDLKGRYCFVHEMWVVSTPAGERLAIDMPESQISLMTKTKTHTEQDDAPSLSAIGMLQTKTEAQLEQEDQPQGVLIAAFQTKTSAGREADDAAEMLV